MNQPNAKLELIPVAIEMADVQVCTQDDWLSNNAAEIIDQVAATNNEKPIHAHSITYHCDSLIISTSTAGFMLATKEGIINLLSGDIVRVGNQCFKVNIHEQIHFAPITKEISHRASSFSAGDDIWSSDEDLKPSKYIPDPFANQQPKNFAAVQSITRSATPVVKQQDPLNFLYDHHTAPSYNPNSLLPSLSSYNDSTNNFVNSSLATTPNYFAEPYDSNTPISTQNLSDGSSIITQGQGNVLNDLGIDAASSTITQKDYGQNKPDFLDKSPIDMLDEYLSNDEDKYSRNNYAAIQQSELISHEPTAAPAKNWLDGVKGAIKSVKKR